MKYRKTFITVLVILVIAMTLLVIFPFHEERTEKKAFTPYVSAYTSGVVSKRSAIRVMLMEEIPGVTPNDRAEGDMFEFKPDIEGEAYWIDSRTLEFRPAELLVSGKEYSAAFALNKVIQVPRELKSFTFSFQTIEQSYETSFKGLQAYDPQNLKYQKLLGKLHTADFATGEEVKQMLRVKQDGELKSVSWQHGPDGKIHRYIADSIVRKEEEADVVLQWAGSTIGSEKRKEEDIVIPALSDFDVLSLDVNHQPEQSVSVVFSDPIDEGQDLEGLIRFESGTALDYLIDGNEVRLFPEVRQKGEDELIIEPSVMNTLGYALDQKWSSRISFQSIKPAVEFLGDGNILPRSDKLILPFKAVNLKGVNVRIIKIFEENVFQFFQVNHYGGDDELKRVGRIVFHNDIELNSNEPIDYGVWNTFSLDLSRLIEPEPGAIYRVQLNFDKSQSLYPCPGDDQEDDAKKINPEAFEREQEANKSEMHYWHYRGYNYYDYKDDYSWSERDDPCKPSYYMRYNQARARNVLASNLGIIAKRGEGNDLFVAVTNLKTTKPLPGVQLEVYNFQQERIAFKETNSQGMARIKFDSKPYLVVAKKNKQFGYLRVDDGSSLSLSKFNVSGRETQHGMKGFIYGERGVWRPGDSLFLSFMLFDESGHLPQDHPVLLELINPRGQVVQQKVNASGRDGLYGFRLKTQVDAPTGRWKARVKVGGAVFSKDVPIETIKPNRLKLELDFDRERFTNDDVAPRGILTAKWLHGATAANLKADVKMRLVSAGTSFSDYPGYHFEDPARSYSSEERTIFDGRLNGQGQATVKPELNPGEQAPGMLKAGFSLRAFEQSGNFSTTYMSVPYSPYSSYVGLKVPEGNGWQGALSYDQTYKLPVVTVDENGLPVSRNNLEVRVYKLRWRWWWERNENDNLSRYVGSSSRNLMHRGNLKTTNGKGFYDFKIEEKYWGRVLIRVVDKKSGHSAGQITYVTYPGWNRKEMPGGATMLSFSTDKDTYQTGEQVMVKMPSTAGGRALVSLENGTRILNSFWVKTADKFTQFNFETTPEMAPNVYVHISLLQPHNQAKNDLPVRLYGVQPVRVEDKQTHLNPLITMPEEIRPLEDVSMAIQEQHGNPMNYTIAVVDEGLLDITAYRTPRPWDHFYARDALGVKTWDMFDYVIGAFSGELAGLYEIGGGLEEDGAGSGEAQRFKPVVKYFGPFRLGANQTNTHRFTMPNYIGSVKTMVVAGHKGSFGSADEVTPVKKPLMVQVTLPRVVGPGEQITLPVSVFAMEEGIKSVNVRVETNELCRSVEGNTQTVRFAQTGDKVINFSYKVAERLGVARFKVIATSGSERAESAVEIQVRSPNPRISRVIDQQLKGGATSREFIEPVGMKGTNNAVLEVSRFMPMNLDERLGWLIRYPHGCVEQVTSSVFPQLYLKNLIHLDDQQKKEIQDNVRAGINRLMDFQLPEGGFSYWPGRQNVSNWGTNYAGHFLLEAREKGYDLPEGMISNWISYQKQAARGWSADNYYDTYRSTGLTQAYRLYTLALAGDPEKGAMNRLRKSEGLKIQARWRLAAAYFLAGKEKVAQELISNMGTEVDPYHQPGRTYGSHVRDKAMFLETLTLMGQDNRARGLLKDLGEHMASDHWYSTQTTAFTLLAVSKHLGTHDPDEPLRFEYSTGGKPWKPTVTNMPFAQIDLPIDENDSLEVKVRNSGSNIIFSRILLDGIPAAGEVQDEEHNLGMDVEYLDMTGNTIDVSRLEQGTDFMAKVTVTNRDIQDVEEMALTQIFPSGWEIHNFRLDRYGQAKIDFDDPEYQDIRDDRVCSYFDLEEKGNKTFVVQLNASYLGRYYLPSVYCEAMYDHAIRAQKGGQWVEVVRAGSE